MSRVLLKNILDASFRANPEYQLYLFDRLPPDQQDTLRDLTKDPDFYGVLIPPEGSGRNTKSVCRDTALLLYTLSQPGTLPAYVRTTLGENCNQAVAELVLDGILQIERDGTFVCGSEAYALIYGERAASEAKGVCARLTQAALDYGQALDIEDTGRLSARLYFYNRVPLSTAWRRRFPDEDSVARYLGIESGGANQRMLEGRWEKLKSSSPFDGWFQWEGRIDRPPQAEARKIYKLYVSPRPECMREAFQVVLEVLAGCPAHHLKAGSEAAGVLRADKLIAYFWNFEALDAAAKQIRAQLGGCPAQGVPFTAALGDDGLLSWGVDPLPEKYTLSWQERPSWRLWITNRLATALLAAKNAKSDGGPEPWRFALERLRLENVDTDSWTPLEGFGRAV